MCWNAMQEVNGRSAGHLCEYRETASPVNSSLTGRELDGVTMVKLLLYGDFWIFTMIVCRY
jgi:hypothetical protein